MFLLTNLTYQESADIRLETAAGLSGIIGVREESNCGEEFDCSFVASIFNVNQSWRTSSKFVLLFCYIDI